MPKISFREPEKMAAVDADATLADCRRWIAAAGGRREWDDTRESWLARAAWRLGITPSRCATLFYGKVASIKAHEYLTLKHRADALLAAANSREDEIDALRRRLAALDSQGGQLDRQARREGSAAADREGGEPR